MLEKGRVDAGAIVLTICYWVGNLMNTRAFDEPECYFLSCQEHSCYFEQRETNT
jgi:hypothetical protein